MITSVRFHEDIQNSKGMNYRSNTSFWTLTSAKIPSGFTEICPLIFSNELFLRAMHTNFEENLSTITGTQIINQTPSGGKQTKMDGNTDNQGYNIMPLPLDHTIVLQIHVYNMGIMKDP